MRTKVSTSPANADEGLRAYGGLTAHAFQHQRPADKASLGIQLAQG
ncbi:MAG: hypothetical protein KKB13_01790 [Chloroflexi bacterium]|nr:hypothetical protein [Chloroflexota bacterium]